jgi:archaellin
MELKGSVVLTTTNAMTGSDGEVSTVIFTIANVAGGAPVDLTDTTGGSNTVVIDYRDQSQRKTNLDWSVTFLGSDDGDSLLEEGELAEVTIADLENGSGEDNALATSLGSSTDFALEIKPPQGGVLVLERTTPARIDQVMDLQ